MEIFGGMWGGLQMLLVNGFRLQLHLTGIAALTSGLHSGPPQANPSCSLRHLHMRGNKDPSAGAKLVFEPGTGGFVIAGMSRAEQLLAQALNIGRQLRGKRHLHIYDD